MVCARLPLRDLVIRVWEFLKTVMAAFEQIVVNLRSPSLEQRKDNLRVRWVVFSMSCRAFHVLKLARFRGHFPLSGERSVPCPKIHQGLPGRFSAKWRPSATIRDPGCQRSLPADADLAESRLVHHSAGHNLRCSTSAEPSKRGVAVRRVLGGPSKAFTIHKVLCDIGDATGRFRAHTCTCAFATARCSLVMRSSSKRSFCPG